jgi:AcrR family transcriptional regulator
MSNPDQTLDQTAGEDLVWTDSERTTDAPAADVLESAYDAALTLAVDRPWGEISLRDISRAAGLSFSELYAKCPGKAALMDKFSRRLDRIALVSADEDHSADIADRLFEAVMARLEAMQPNRSALIAIAQAEGVAALAPRLPRTARAMLEAAGIDTDGPRGTLRVAAMTGVWARVLQVWRDDEGALNRTMAEIDKRLKQMNTRLGRVGAGY